jgi:hypothetical protein
VSRSRKYWPGSTPTERRANLINLTLVGRIVQKNKFWSRSPYLYLYWQAGSWNTSAAFREALPGHNEPIPLVGGSEIYTCAFCTVRDMGKIIFILVLTCSTQPSLHSLSVLRQPDGTTKDQDVPYPPHPAFRTIVVLGGIRVVSKGLQPCGGTLSLSDYSAYLRQLMRADERTRTAYPLLITNVRSCVAEGCTALQITHSKRGFFAL